MVTEGSNCTNIVSSQTCRHLSFHSSGPPPQSCNSGSVFFLFILWIYLVEKWLKDCSSVMTTSGFFSVSLRLREQERRLSGPAQVELERLLLSGSSTVLLTRCGTSGGSPFRRPTFPSLALGKAAKEIRFSDSLGGNGRTSEEVVGGRGGGGGAVTPIRNTPDLHLSPPRTLSVTESCLEQLVSTI